MSYELSLSKKSLKFLEKHPKEEVKFIEAFRNIVRGNFEKYDIKQMKGNLEDCYRLRIGKYRAIYSIFEDILILHVIDIDSRGDIYK